jgi:hypothetical protein
MTEQQDRYREWDAAYVLGALGPHERREFEEHLATCDQCRQAVGELAGMPALLGLVDSAQAQALVEEPAAAAGPDGPGGRTGQVSASEVPGATVVDLARVARVARRRRSRRRVLAAVAAAALLVVGGSGGALVHRATQGATVEQTVADGRTLRLDPAAGVAMTADVTLTDRPWGTRLDWSCDYATDAWAGATYELVLVDDTGQRTVVATWRAAGSAAYGLGASSSLSLPDVRSVQITRAGDDDPLAGADL